MVQDAGLARGMTVALGEVKLGLRPGAVQVPRGLRGTGDIIAALDDDAGNAPQPVRVADELPLLHPAGIDEVMVLDAREG